MKSNFTKFLMASCLPLAAYGQTFVNTNPENKKVILEEFTGINCVYCPSGHQIAKEIQDTNPGNVFLINIHQGGFATPSGNQPDYRTPFGNGIANQSGLTGYPAGTVNRHVFAGMGMSSNSTAMGRDKWGTASNQILAQSSYVNAAVQSSVNASTREMTITVEVYYTGNSPVGTNKLNVALLQNNTRGPQTGGNQGNNYNHMHRLIHMITGQWGEEITTTTAGTFVSKTYTYAIPEHLNNIPIVMGELELVAFVSEGNQEIISGNGNFPSYTGLPLNNDISIANTYAIKPTCEGTVSPKIQIKNNGNNVLTSLDINYSLNGGDVQTYTWTGNLGGLQSVDVVIPEIAFTENENTISFAVPSDEDNQNNAASVEFVKAPVGTTTLKLEIRTDAYGDETSWHIKNSAGVTVQQGSNYPNNQSTFIDFELPITDCYTFHVVDSWGDGGARATLKDSNNQTLFNIIGTTYTTTANAQFSVDGEMGIGDQTLSAVQIYPNPSTGILNVELTQKANIQVFDVTGKLVQSMEGKSGVNTLNLSGKGKGVFVVKIQDGSKTATKKVIIK
jgi:hypothetical protein